MNKKKFAYFVLIILIVVIVLFATLIAVLVSKNGEVEPVESRSGSGAEPSPGTSDPEGGNPWITSRTDGQDTEPAVTCSEITTVSPGTVPVPTETEKPDDPVIPDKPEYPDAITVSTASVLSSFSTRSPYVALYNATSDTLIYSTDLERKIYPASTTKVLTSMYALTLCEPDEVITVGNEVYMIAPDSSKAGLKVDEKFTLEQLLMAMLMKSGNDAAYVVANHCGKKLAEDQTISDFKAISVFLDGMNEYARSIGMLNTHYTTPDGYHSDYHYTTLYDLLVMTKVAVSNTVITNITSQYKVSFKNVTGQKYEFTNTNQLLDSTTSYYTKNIIGFKTGFTSKAGNCLISAVKANGKVIIALCYGADKAVDRFVDAHNMLTYGLEFKEA